MLNTPASPHIHAPVSVTRVMLQVLLALIPGMIVYTWFFGWGLIINGMIAVATALACETAMLRLRDRPLAPFLTDGSAVVTAILLALCLPPLAPWWITFLGCAFAIIVAKHLYGGLGYNPFNPAMIGYVMLLISFPREMTAWLSPLQISALDLDFFATLQTILTGVPPDGLDADAISMATPLDLLRTQIAQGLHAGDIIQQNPLFGTLAGIGWEWLSLAFLLGGIYLLYRRIIHWHIPLAVLAGLAVMAGIFYLFEPGRYTSPLLHLFSGGAMLGAFFIATDPVTASTTPRGRLIYGAGIGILTYVIRAWGGYPDAMAFAVLLMNMAAPTIDHYTQPRVYGHKRS